MGFSLYIICSDGDFIYLGKELEVYANHIDAVAMLKFIFDKMELHKTLWLRRFGLHDDDEEIMKTDVSKDYLADAKEEIERP